MFAECLLLGAALTSASAAAALGDTFTFKSVVMTCDSDDESPFATYVTSNTLHTHLPSEQRCSRLSVTYATIPVLRAGSVADVENVGYLLLENDRIEEVEPGAFRNLRLREALSLRSNRIKEIRRGVFNNIQVPSLFLSDNLISYIDFKAFDNMTTLRSIHLDRNKLTRIDSFLFENTPKLNKINFEHNRIAEVPRFAFQNLGNNSVSIDLGHNWITRVDPEALRSLRRIDFLSLAHNRIESLDDFWLNGVKLTIFDVSANRIRCLRGGLAEPHSTNFVDMNPWSCGCLEELKKRECRTFGRIVADRAMKRCNLLLENNNNCL